MPKIHVFHWCHDIFQRLYIYIYVCYKIWFCVFNFPVSNLLIHSGVAKLTQFRSTLARHLRLCGPKVLGRMVEALELQLGRRVFTTVPSCSSPWWMVGDYFGYFYTHCITRLGRPKNDLGWTCQFCAMNCVFLHATIHVLEGILCLATSDLHAFTYSFIQHTIVEI